MGLILTSAPAVEPLTAAEVSYRLRLDSGNVEPAPVAPSAAPASPAAPGNVDNGAHRYIVTFVTADGETQAGLESAVVTVADKTVNGQVLLSNIQCGGSLVIARKIYRTKVGSSVYYLMATLADNVATSYTDNIADASLGAQAPVVNTTGDPLLKSLIITARQQCEQRINCSLVTQSWKRTLDSFYTLRSNCLDSSIRLAGKLQSVESVKYIDSNGVQQTLANTEYQVVGSELIGRILPAYGKSWPSCRQQPDAIEISYTCGFGNPIDIPQSLKSWMIMYVGALLDNPSASESADELPREFFAGLLDRYTIPTI